MSVRRRPQYRVCKPCGCIYYVRLIKGSWLSCGVRMCWLDEQIARPG